MFSTDNQGRLYEEFTSEVPLTQAAGQCNGATTYLEITQFRNVKPGLHGSDMELFLTWRPIKGS